jgi:hypothetical protein
MEMFDEEDNLDSLKEELHVGTEAGQSPVMHKAKIKLVKICLDVLSVLIPSSLYLELKHNL